jgi:hypothetical protein
MCGPDHNALNLNGEIRSGQGPDRRRSIPWSSAGFTISTNILGHIWRGPPFGAYLQHRIRTARDEFDVTERQS